jgi:hypothetical protein
MYQAPPPVPARAPARLIKGCLILLCCPFIVCAGLQAIGTSAVIIKQWSIGKSISVTYPAAFLLSVDAAAWIFVVTMIWILFAAFAKAAPGQNWSPRKSAILLTACGVSFIFIALATVMPDIAADWFR